MYIINGMKLIKLSAVLILVFCSYYLYSSYAGLYNFIRAVNLKSPYNQTPLVLENSRGFGSVKYVALGDSLSAGVGSWDVKKTFVYRYALKLSDTYGKVDLINLAYPGDTTAEVIDNQIARAIKEKPDYVTLLVGANDIHNKRTVNDFRKNYRFILNELLTKTNAQITVINIPYLGSDKIVYPPFNFLLNVRTRQFNKVVSDLVGSADNPSRIRLVDLYNNTYKESKQNPKYYSSDLFHPSEESYLFWSRIINAD